MSMTKIKKKTPKKFEDEELQALLDEDATQTQDQLASSLNVTQKTLCARYGKDLERKKMSTICVDRKKQGTEKIISQKKS